MSFDISNTYEFLRRNAPQVTKEEDVLFNKYCNSLYYKANKMGILSKCELCGKKIVGKANSHSIPQSILKNIEVSDRYYYPITYALNNNIYYGPIGRKNRYGLNNTGTFHMLCEECENRVFKDYEQDSFIFNLSKGDKELLSSKILAKIWLKSALRKKFISVFTKNFSMLINEENVTLNYSLNEEYDDNSPIDILSPTPFELDILELEHYVAKCKNIINGKEDDEFSLYYFDILDYPSSFACQTLLPIQKSLNNITINDVYNYDSNYQIALSLFTIFPTKTKTICFACCLKKEVKRIEPYINYLNSLNLTARRKLFQSTLFLYSDEVYTNKEKIDELVQDQISLNYISKKKKKKIFGSVEPMLLKPKLMAPYKFRKARFLL